MCAANIVTLSSIRDLNLNFFFVTITTNFGDLQKLKFG
jgi:hypothetical protein